MKSISIFLVYLFSIPGWASSQEKKSSPNIIFIMADDLGYGDLGCYGQNKIKTPNIDQLASEGIKFLQCYAGSPVCAPSRSVLMTGQHTGHTTVRGNTGLHGVVGLGGAKWRVPLNADDITVAELLQSAGYTTACIGKWGLGEPNTPGEPRNQGFDYFFGYLNQRRAHDYYTEYLWENEDIFPLNNENGQENDYSHDFLTDKAIQFIERQNGQNPFFLYLPYTIPHDEYEVPDLNQYASKTWEQKEKIYAAMVTRMDGDIGKILNKLKQKNLEQNTIVFFCSDNGAAQRWDRLFDSSGALRGRKRDLYEGGIRTPMIIKYPGHIQAGTVSDFPWYFADVKPTLCELVGISPDKNIDGINVLSAFHGKKVRGSKKRIFYWEFHERELQQALRIKDWKVIKLSYDTEAELYNIAEDPSEKLNVASSHPKRVKKMMAILRKSRTPSGSWPTEID